MQHNTLTGIARQKGVTIDTVLRLKGPRVSQREIQRRYFQAVKEIVKSAAGAIAAEGTVVTVKGVMEGISGAHKRTPSRGIVSKALGQLAAEGIIFPRPPEFERAMAKGASEQVKLAETDARIVGLRKKFPKMRDEALAEKLEIPYWLLRKRITALKKAGKIPPQRRGYMRS